MKQIANILQRQQWNKNICTSLTMGTQKPNFKKCVFNKTILPPKFEQENIS